MIERFQGTSGRQILIETVTTPIQIHLLDRSRNRYSEEGKTRPYRPTQCR